MVYIVQRWVGGCKRFDGGDYTPWAEGGTIVADDADHAFRLASALHGCHCRVRSEGNFSWYSR